MIPKELMIGDWVYDKHYNGDIEPIKIYNIYGNEVNCKTERNRFDVDEIVSGTYMSDLQPIPLTLEILEKNGFKECTDGDWTNDNVDFIFYRRKDGIFRIRNTNMTLPYVSSFQHALRLCSINKEIII